MTHHVVFSPRAEAQLLKLYRSIATRASPAIAENYVAAIIEYCRSLSVFPERGARRDDIRPRLRTVGYRRRITLAFEVTDDSVNILGVYYGGQDFEADFEGDD
jgi:toxin ParE1/3/4